MRHVVFGCNGSIGLALMERLAADGEEVVGVCRRGAATVPPGVVVEKGDALDRARTIRAAMGADVLHSTIGLAYDARVWERDWMPIVENLLAAAGASGARLVFADNLYCYGPQDEPLREDTPLTSYGRKPALRARLARRLEQAHAQGEARVAIVRASDFVGPGAGDNSMLGSRVFPAALRGGRAELIGRVDLPHTYTFVPDFARALAIAAREDAALGRAWHVPSPPTRTTRDLVEEIFALAGTRPRMVALPGPAIRALGLFSPILRELAEMSYQWTRPYVVDATAFERTFAMTATPWETILPTTLAWFRESAT